MADEGLVVIHRRDPGVQLGLDLEEVDTGGLWLQSVDHDSAAFHAGCSHYVGQWLTHACGIKIGIMSDLLAAIQGRTDIPLLFSPDQPEDTAGGRQTWELQLSHPGEHMGISYSAMSTGDIDVTDCDRGGPWARCGLPCPCVLCSIDGAALRCGPDLENAVASARQSGRTTLCIVTAPTGHRSLPPGSYKLLSDQVVLAADTGGGHLVPPRRIERGAVVRVEDVLRSDQDRQLRGELSPPGTGWIVVWDLAARESYVEAVAEEGGTGTGETRISAGAGGGAARRHTAMTGRPRPEPLDDPRQGVGSLYGLSAPEVLERVQAMKNKDPAVRAVTLYTDVYCAQVRSMAAPRRPPRQVCAPPQQFVFVMRSPPRQAGPRPREALGASTVSRRPSFATSAATGRSRGAGDEAQRAALSAHNKLRARHGAQPLQVSPSCQQNAAMQAENCAGTGVLSHGNKPGQGQNCAMLSGPITDAGAVTKAVQMWYDEIRDWQPGGGFSPATGHFTQVVWKATKEVGVAVARDRNQRVWVVANYAPPGNMRGQFSANVET
eukprot:TRINITY_DN35397_c0_g1_i1.p1 TRINITY_DN35397_c0_g1~~TRINITY_DN35397_c0_g1_i1.p1  ORF type:complete len:571 (+),score=121.06 TRINITY_DN35397_c0_g1_i1:67-1713(+)